MEARAPAEGNSRSRIIDRLRERADYYDPHPIDAQYISGGGRCPMANVVKKHSISSELAQKMVDEAVAKARELGVTENVAILDDGGNLKAFRRMDGAPILCIEMAQNKAYTALFGVSTQDFFNFIQGDPSLLAGIPTLGRVAAWGGGFPIEGERRSCRGDRVERGAHGAERRRLRESSAGARTRCGAD
jgi:uncharacterized protein GlcG (DUF336 family)